MYFFFQAEDGIRDFHVTGVQTCALPILGGAGAPRSVDHDAGAVLRQLLVLHRAAAVAVLGIPVVALVAAVVLVALVAVAALAVAALAVAALIVAILHLAGGLVAVAPLRRGRGREL